MCYDNLVEKILQWLTPKRAIFIIICVGLIVYFNSLFNGFVWDDEEQIVNNAIIQHLSNLPQIFSGATFNTGGAGLSGWFFRPFLTFTYMINFALFGQNAWGYHLFALVFHLVNGVLIFKILQRLNKGDKKLTLLVNTLIATTFVVLPAIVEAVSYIAALSEVLFTFFNLLTFYLILKSQIITIKRGLVVGILLMLGMFNKESSIVIFPILATYLVLFRHPAWKKWLLVLLITVLVYFFIRLVIVQAPIRHPEYSPISEAPLSVRVMTMPLELMHYLGIIFYPKDLAISQQFVVNTPNLEQFVIPLVLDVLFLGLMIYLAWKLKSKLMFLGLVWFLIGFGLVSNVFPLDMTIAERWLYFPVIGLFLSFGVILSYIFEHWKRFNVQILICTLLIISAFGVRTMVRNSDWHDGLTLFAHDNRISQNSFDLENNLGVELFRKGEIEEAKVHFQKSIDLQPKWYFAHNNLGAVYEREKNYSAAKAQYQKTLEYGDYYLAHENLAEILLFHESTSSAQLSIQNSLKKLPNNPKLWLLLALADYQLGKKDEALMAAKNSYLLQPTQQSYYVISRLEQNQPLQFE